MLKKSVKILGVLQGQTLEQRGLLTTDYRSVLKKTTIESRAFHLTRASCVTEGIAVHSDVTYHVPGRPAGAGLVSETPPLQIKGKAEVTGEPRFSGQAAGLRCPHPDLRIVKETPSVAPATWDGPWHPRVQYHVRATALSQAWGRSSGVTPENHF